VTHVCARMPDRKWGHSANDKLRKTFTQPGIVQRPLRSRRRAKIVDEHIGSAQKPVKLCTSILRIQVKNQAALGAIPHNIARLGSGSIPAWRLNLDDARASFGEQPG
jgi:hypothetical protein